MQISVVMPVYNEQATIAEIIRRVLNSDLVSELLVVDDGSTDGTSRILGELDHSDPRLIILRKDRNEGKGAAVRLGFEKAVSPIILIQDADLEYDPRHYPVLLRPLEEGLADVVYGSRFLGEARRPILFWNMVANKMLTLVTNVLYNTILTDMETGYKVFRREVIQGMRIRARRFEFEPEVTARLLKHKVRLFEVPIAFNPRDYSEGKKIRMRDGFYALWTLVKYRFVD